MHRILLAHWLVNYRADVQISSDLFIRNDLRQTRQNIKQNLGNETTNKTTGQQTPPPHELTRRNNNQQKSNNLFSLAMMSMMKCSRFLRKWSLNNWTLTLLHKLLYYTNVFYCFGRGRLMATTPRCRTETTNFLKRWRKNKIKTNLFLRVACYTFR